MINIQNNIEEIKQKIQTIAKQCERDPQKIILVAVSKTKPVELIEDAIKAGQIEFGENYVQEGVSKIEYFQASHPEKKLVWHFIGPLQSNKTKLVAENFNWIHTIDRIKIAERLSTQRPEYKLPLNVLIQVNISDENSKSGVKPEDIFALAQKITQLPNLKLRGLMAIPAVEADFERQLITFQKMTNLYRQLQQQFSNIDTLSMGMSDDMEAAITAGSTMIRIGSAIFGKREYPQ